MKSILLAGFTFLTLLAFTNCENQANSTSAKAENHDDQSDAIQMNDGNKWKVNDEMMIHVRDMETKLVAFEKSEVKDFSALAKDLKTGIGELTSSCTMTGKSHDALHKWLLPFIKTTEALNEAINNEDAAKEVGKIQTSMATFNKFFE